MRQYVDRDAVLRLLVVARDREKVRQIPTADVEPVHHGRWCNKAETLPDPAGFGLIPVRNVWRCSECGFPIINETEDPDRLFKYCPQCGAKMDGEEAEHG